MAKVNKAKRQEKRKVRQERRVARKDKRIDYRQTTSRRARKTREGDKADERADRESEAAIKLNEMKENRAAAEESRLAQLEEAQANAEQSGTNELNDLQKMKAGKYLAKRGVKPYKDAGMRAAQVIDERETQINERMQPEIDELNEDISMSDEEKTEYMPDAEDIHEEILDEEYEQANFDGMDKDSADYLDAETIGVLYNVGKSATDKYREKQFAQGKKAFGQTKEQWDKKQAAAKKGDTVLAAAQGTAEDEIKKQKIKEYTPMIIGGIILVAFLIGAAYFSGRKK